MQSPNNPTKRMKAEWDIPSAILITFPSRETDWNYVLTEAREQYISLASKLLNAGERLLIICSPEDREQICKRLGDRPYTLIDTIGFNDTWTRDYGPITVVEEGTLKLLDFGFNGWGLKFAADKDNLVNLNLHDQGLLNGFYENHRDFNLEGGSIESDGRGTILTTSRCLCSPNRNGGKSKEEIEVILRERLGASNVLWLDHGFLAGDDTDSHIDTLARLAPDDTIIYVTAPDDPADIHHDELKKMEAQLKEMRTLSGQPYRLVALPFPDAIYDEEGQRLPATYANYLVTGQNVFVPVYGQPLKDEEALKAIGEVFVGRNVIPVDCRTLILQHGSLHCSTMQLY